MQKTTSIATPDIVPVDKLVGISAAERSAILRMRDLKPFERIEIKLKNNQEGQIAITSTFVAQETFPSEMV